MSTIYKIIFSTVLIVGAFVLLGVVIEGFYQWHQSYFLRDKLFALAFIILGIIFIIVSYQSFRKMLKTEQTSISLNNQKTRIALLSLILTIVLMNLDRTFLTAILYAGALVGDFLFFQARLGWIQFTNIDLFHTPFTFLVWFAEWFFLYTILDSVYRLVVKIRTSIK